jgi:PHD/YefM family antitoxin component YafN of YafNO toxin-antitoxin module
METEIENLLEALDEADYEKSIPGNLAILLGIMAGEWAKGK